MGRASRWIAWAVVIAALAGAGVARAIPSAAASTIPSHILLVGRTGDLADTTAGAFTVVVRDFANAPVAFIPVEVRILNCPGARLSSQPYDPASTIRCSTLGVLQTTSVVGEARVTVVGGGTPGAPAGAGPCVQIYASGVFLGTATLAYADLDGSGGLGGNDISLWLADLGSGEPIGRSDFDGDALLGANDLSIWLSIWGAGLSSQSPAAYCP